MPQNQREVLIKNTHKAIVSMLDIFDKQLSFEDILNTELPLLYSLFDCRLEYIEEKKKAEAEALRKAQESAARQNKQKTNKNK